MNRRKNEILIDCICGLLVFIFLYSGIDKLREHTNFETQIKFIVPYPAMGNILSYAVPAGELITAILITINQTKRTGIYAFISLMTAFTFYIIFMLGSGKNLPCTCGGFINTLSWKQHLVFNIGFILLAAAALYLTRKIIHRLQQKKAF
jgi:uncharacterized membrane protein YphA (DoxX/SURF4 family)